MPVYEYLCDECGPFTEMRPMAECEAPLACPHCRQASPRAYLTPPNFSGLSSERRHAFATNERSANAPTLSSKSHGAGCACCSGKSSRMTRRGKDGSKSFPTSRPWMISH